MTRLIDNKDGYLLYNALGELYGWYRSKKDALAECKGGNWIVRKFNPSPLTDLDIEMRNLWSPGEGGNNVMRNLGVPGGIGYDVIMKLRGIK